MMATKKVKEVAEKGKHSRRPTFTLAPDNPLAVAAKKAGGRDKLAAGLGITMNTLRGLERMSHRGKPIPAKYVLNLAGTAKMKPSAFRPDLYLEKWRM